MVRRAEPDDVAEERRGLRPGIEAGSSLVLLFTVVQMALGLLGHSYAIAGGIHGANALILFGLAVMVFMKSEAVPVSATTAPGRADQPTRV